MMKNIGFYFALMCLLGCSNKEDALSPAQAEFIGKWQLVEFCQSPGDGSCPVQAVSPATTQILDFRADGSYLENRPQPGQSQAPINSSGEYRLEVPDVVYFKFDPVNFVGQGVNAPTQPVEVKWHYTLNRNILIVKPTCREACAYTYKKI